MQFLIAPLEFKDLGESISVQIKVTGLILDSPLFESLIHKNDISLYIYTYMY